MKRSLIAVSTLLFVCSMDLLAQAPVPAKDPRLGLWKLNLAKSKFANPAPNVRVASYVARADGFTV